MRKIWQARVAGAEGAVTYRENQEVAAHLGIAAGVLVTSIIPVPPEEGLGLVIDLSDDTRRVIPECRVWWYDLDTEEQDDASVS